MKITESNEDKIMYELIKKDGLAKRGRLHTVHGVIETPVFMNVGTAAAIKGRWNFQIRIISMCVREMKL